jgi:hypothetical protein
MKPRRDGEDAESYIRRLEASNAELRKLRKWAERVSRAVTALATEGSVVFQAMAEKARVRSHPSVTKAVELFDMIAHPQWTADDAPVPQVDWPADWDFDPPGAQSGDADMQLNSPISDAIEYLDGRLYGKLSADERRHIQGIIDRLHAATMHAVEGVKEAAGFRPMRVALPPKEHFRDMGRDELEQLVTAMSWMALDLAQDMSCTNEMLRRDLRAAAYRRIQADLYRLASLDTNTPPGQINVKVFASEEIPF